VATKDVSPAAVPAGKGPKGEVLDAELLADFGHQLRNQLNAVLGAAGLLSMTATTNEEGELASIVEVGAEQVARLVEEVLDAAMIQGGEFELALHPFDVRSSVEACLGLISEAAGAKGVDLSFQADPDVPSFVVGDSRRLEQIILALLHGALDRTERGGVGVLLQRQLLGEFTGLRFIIRDTGKGVPARILRRALDGVGDSKGLEPGDRLAVLSLATCKHLVEMMDGELRVEQGGVEAGPDAGTQFEFTMLAEALPAPVATAPLTLEAMKTLIVAAEPTERRVMALQTELWGARTTGAPPAEASPLVQAGHPFDVAVIEHRLPVINGLGISASIRALRGPEVLPIVLIAAAALGGEEAAAADAGLVQATLTKPVAPSKLHDVMAPVGARRPVAAPAKQADVIPGALTVLIADDNSLNQNLLRRLVAKLGLKVDVVANGREAVAAVAQSPYDVVLMDVLMPEMDGLEAAEAICRRWPRGTRPRLIALTALSGPGDQERCLKAGFDDYMSKPVHLEELAEAFKVAAGWRTNT